MSEAVPVHRLHGVWRVLNAGYAWCVRYRSQASQGRPVMALHRGESGQVMSEAVPVHRLECGEY